MDHTGMLMMTIRRATEEAIKSKPSEVQQSDSPEEEQQGNKEVHHPKEAVEVLNALDQQLGSPEMTDTLAAKFVTGLAREDTERSVNEIAKALNTDSEHAQSVLDSAYAAYYNQTAKAIEKASSGLNGLEVLESLSETLTTQEKASLANRIYLGDPSIINELIDKFNRLR